jgi:DNA-binding transcriptional regulator YdaS (Cro superfamily)
METSENSNPVDLAISKFKSLNDMARQLGVTYQAIQEWRRQGRVPPPHCPKIEKILNGDVRCEQLNDEIDWAYLRSTEPTA